MRATRGDVVAVLRSHGLSSAAAAAFWTIARDLLARTRRRNREHSALIDAESGIQAGPMLSGESHRVEIGGQLSAMQRGRAYGHLHTHPGSTSFSTHDIRVLLDNTELCAMVVAGLDGRWYAMSHVEGARIASGWDASDAFYLEFEVVLNERLVARLEMPHITWSRIAPRLGLRYDRIEGTAR